VRGAGQITDNYFGGDRPWFHDWDSLAMLARRVYKLAKISNPMNEIQVAEPYVAFSIQELMEYEALGFADPGKGAELIRKGVTAMTGKVPFCPSGGTLCTNPIGGQGRQAAGAQRQDGPGPLLGCRYRLSHHDDPGQGSSLEGGGRLL
jgi:acetyl-CoA C-acetyltransferase